MNHKTHSILEDYIKNVINVEFAILPVTDEKLGRLSYALTSLYSFGTTRLFDREVVFMFVDPNETSIDRIQKHMQIVRNAWSVLVVAIMDHIEAYTRRRLIEKKVPFIIPGKQMYLPDLLIDLKEFNIMQKEQHELMPPSAQCVFLHYLQAHKLENRNMKRTAEILHYDPMTISRAADFLETAGLCEILGTKDKWLSFDKDKRTLWDKALPLMTSPVKRVNYYNGQIHNDQLRRTNINALAYYSDLNDERIKYYAAPAGFIAQFEGADFINTGRMIGDICVEEWKYDPTIVITNPKFVDPLSLYLCFKEEKNERVEDALEQIIENMKW